MPKRKTKRNTRPTNKSFAFPGLQSTAPKKRAMTKKTTSKRRATPTQFANSFVKSCHETLRVFAFTGYAAVLRDLVVKFKAYAAGTGVTMLQFLQELVNRDMLELPGRYASIRSVNSKLQSLAAKLRAADVKISGPFATSKVDKKLRSEAEEYVMLKSWMNRARARFSGARAFFNKSLEAEGLYVMGFYFLPKDLETEQSVFLIPTTAHSLKVAIAKRTRVAQRACDVLERLQKMEKALQRG